MNDLDFLIIDFSSESFDFHFTKEAITYTEACKYRDSLGEGWHLISPRMLAQQDREVLASKLEPLEPVDFWMDQGVQNWAINSSERQGLYIKYRK